MHLTHAGNFMNRSCDVELEVFVDQEGMPWFDATYVCSFLEYSSKAADILRRIDSDEKLLLNRAQCDRYSESTSGNKRATERSGLGLENLQPGPVKKWFVNEFGLYALILGSEKKEAKKFKRWVTHEVLPSIRKTGSYSIVQKDLSLKAIHEAYILVEKLPWNKEFPDLYHKEVCRLFDLGEYYPGRPLPDVVGMFSRRFVYGSLPPGVYEEVKALKERLKDTTSKLHQYLSDDAKEHLYKIFHTVITLIRVSDYRYPEFKRVYYRAIPDNHYDRLIEERSPKVGLVGQLSFPFDEFAEN